MTPTNSLNDWSAGYFITTEQVRLVDWDKDYPVMSFEMAERLSYEDNPIVIKANSRHYYPKIEASVPTDVIAVPDNPEMQRDENVLVAKPETVDMFLNGQID